MKRLTLFLFIILLYSCAGTKNSGDGNAYDDNDNLPSVEEFNEMSNGTSDDNYLMDDDGDGVPDIVDEYPNTYDVPVALEEEFVLTEEMMVESMEMMEDQMQVEEESMMVSPVLTPKPQGSGNTSPVMVMEDEQMMVEHSMVMEDEQPMVALENTTDESVMVVDNTTAVTSEPEVVNPDDLNMGEMSYDIPLSMTVGEAHTVRLRISRKTGNPSLTVGFKNDTTVYRIETGSVMTVLLLDPNPEGVNKQFEIVNLTNGQQALEDDGRINEWSWGVTPTRGGECKLKLVINITKQTEFGPLERSITVFEKDIEISANHRYSIRRFFYTNWEWFASSIAIPLSIFIWRKREDIMKIFKKK